jgi:hypothetical protein
MSVYLVQDNNKIGRILVHILPLFGNVAAIEECNYSYSIAFRGNVDGLYEIFRSLPGRHLF